LWAKYKAPDGEDHFERKRALALLAGMGAEAKSVVAAAKATAFADQAAAALRDALAADGAPRAKVNEADFDAVRERDDLRKLVRELEAKVPAPLSCPPRSDARDLELRAEVRHASDTPTRAAGSPRRL
jgi:hypothetical protein